MAVGVERRRLPVPADCPPPLRKLIKECWRHHAALRPSFAVVLQRLREMRAALGAAPAQHQQQWQHQQQQQLGLGPRGVAASARKKPGISRPAPPKRTSGSPLAGARHLGPGAGKRSAAIVEQGVGSRGPSVARVPSWMLRSAPAI